MNRFEHFLVASRIKEGDRPSPEEQAANGACQPLRQSMSTPETALGFIFINIINKLGISREYSNENNHLGKQSLEYNNILFLLCFLSLN